MNLGDFGRIFRWKENEEGEPTLAIDQHMKRWTEGNVTIGDFDRAWASRGLTWGDIFELAEQLDMTLDEIEDLILRSKKPKSRG